MHANLAGKKQGEHHSCQAKPSFSYDQSLGGGESEYYLDLENEDKKWYTEKSTLLNSESLPDPNIFMFAFDLSVNLIL